MVANVSAAAAPVLASGVQFFDRGPEKRAMTLASSRSSAATIYSLHARMRCAVIVSPWDPRSSDAGTWSDAVAWLGASLGRLGFRVAVVDGADDVDGALARALAGVSADDDVLVHVSGRLARRGVLRTGGGRWVPLRSIGDTLAAHAPAANVALFAELVHEDDADDALVAADHLASVVAALGARERGWGAVATVRPSSAPIEGLAFTRLVLSVADAAPRGHAQLSAIYDRVTAMPESLGAAQSFTHVRGRAELDLAPPPPAPADLDALVEQAGEAGNWSRAVELRRQRLAALASPRQRVRELVGIARVLQAELHDAEGAIDALEQARAIEPRRTSVLQALRRGYETVGRWASAIEVTGALADLTPMPVDRAALRYEQARMALDHLQDEERALVWLEQAIEDDPSHADARTVLAHVRSSLTPPEPMPVPVEPEPDTVPSLAPTEDDSDELDPTHYLRAFAAHQRDGRTDAAYLSALSLEELGAAEMDHQVLIEQFRSVAPVRARGTLDRAAWQLLLPDAADDVLRDLFGSVARAAVLARTEQLAARGRLVALDPTTRLDEASTASVVRSFQWAARVLGVACPELYAVDEVPGEIAAVRQHEPTTAVGPSIIRGRSAKDLAFLAGRHLTYYLPEQQVLVFFPTREELTRLLLAAVQLTKPGLPAGGDGSRAVAALVERLDGHATEEERAALAHAVHRLEARGGRFSLGAYTRNAELMAARAGLFLCGDLATATAVVTTESRGIAGLTLEAKRRDLVAWCASDEHAALRARCAVTAPESLRPPPPAPEAVAYSP
jgi:tetratricopeptide (TPR) repeat protein